MEKHNLNVIIFDEDESSIMQTPSNRQQKQPNQIIQEQLHVLTQKIKQLELQTSNLQFLHNDSHAVSKTNIPEAHGQHILMVIEKKVQIIVKETKKIVDKLGENFDKKIENKLNKKYDEAGISKLKKSYADSLKNIEQHYKKQINKLSQDFKQSENKMLGQINTMQQKLTSKINDFSIKEKEYIDWIHHLQLQLEEKQQKKKMIQVTQDKIGRGSIAQNKNSEQNSVITNSGDNYSSVQPQRSVSPVNQDNSRIQKRRKIFDHKNDNKGSSVSPNHTTYQSEHQPQPYFHSTATMQSSKVINPAIRTKPNQYQPIPLSDPEPVISLTTKATQPLRNNTNVQNEMSPWRVIDKSIEKSYVQGTKRNNMVKDVNEDEFYRDIPKANQGWERFQDFKENDDDSSQSDEEVMFYRQGDPQQQFLDNFRSSKQQVAPKSEEKVFSPFDLN